jgi:lipopolysaccharide transport system permease protein
MMAIYTFVFSVVFQAKWNMDTTQPTPREEFALILFTGITAFNIFSVVTNRSSGLILSVPNYVKKVVFPLEILPVVATASSVITSLISVILILAGSILVYHKVSPTLWLLPLAFLPMVLLTLGTAWFLSSLGVFIRDVGQTTAVITQALFFVTPIVYSADLIPESLRSFIRLNPLTSIVEDFRRTLLWGEMLEWSLWLTITLICAVVALLGYAWFMAIKKGFADVM